MARISTDIIENFLPWRGGWFRKKYFDKLQLGNRFHTTKAALNLLYQRKGWSIVETGCQRLPDDWGAGCSTTVFADVIARHGGSFHSIDISKDSIRLCQDLLGYRTDVTFHNADAVEGLKAFDQRIDLLYLDSLDYPYGDILRQHGGAEDIHAAIEIVNKIPDEKILKEYGDIIIPCQEHQVKELEAASPHLVDTSIILLDDCDLPAGGKCRLSKSWLLRRGWILVLETSQSLWIKRGD